LKNHKEPSLNLPKTGQKPDISGFVPTPKSAKNDVFYVFFTFFGPLLDKKWIDLDCQKAQTRKKVVQKSDRQKGGSKKPTFPKK